MSSKYIISDHQAPHFITFSTVEWVDALSRPEYKNIIIESLKYCQNSKGLVLYAYVIMNNHIHLIAAARETYNLSDILRDLKKYTSKKLLKYIKENDRESRKKWMIWLLSQPVKGIVIIANINFGNRITGPSSYPRFKWSIND